MFSEFELEKLRKLHFKVFIKEQIRKFWVRGEYFVFFIYFNTGWYASELMCFH
jgi:hypothetical protein